MADRFNTPSVLRWQERVTPWRNAASVGGQFRALTRVRKASSLITLRLAKWVLLATLTIALAAYGLDCLGMVTPEQEMQCCDTMQCHSHGHHNQGCCSTTPQVHYSLKPASIQRVPFSPVALGVVQGPSGCEIVQFPAVITSGHSHDPPSLRSIAASPLRI